jgi:hypothetical protein
VPSAPLFSFPLQVRKLLWPTQVYSDADSFRGTTIAALAADNRGRLEVRNATIEDVTGCGAAIHEHSKLTLSGCAMRYVRRPRSRSIENKSAPILSDRGDIASMPALCPPLRAKRCDNGIGRCHRQSGDSACSASASVTYGPATRRLR